MSDRKVRKAIEDLQSVRPIIERVVPTTVREKKAHLLKVYGDFVGLAKVLVSEHRSEIEKMYKV